MSKGTHDRNNKHEDKFKERICFSLHTSMSQRQSYINNKGQDGLRKRQSPSPSPAPSPSIAITA